MIASAKRRKETNHHGLPCAMYRLPNMVRVGHLDTDDMTFIEPETRGFIQISRAHDGHYREMNIPVGTPLIHVCTASETAWKAGNEVGYETEIVPLHGKHSWKVAWSFARRLFTANPHRRAYLFTDEEDQFHLHLGEHHLNCIISGLAR